jgi:hypothetical protein
MDTKPILSDKVSICPHNPTEMRDNMVPENMRQHKYHRPRIKWYQDSRVHTWGSPPSLQSLSHWEATNMNETSRWLLLVYFPIQQFLPKFDVDNLAVAYPALHPTYANSPSAPLRPHLHQRSVSFEKEQLNDSSSTSTANYNLLFHFAYDYFTLAGDIHVSPSPPFSPSRRHYSIRDGQRKSSTSSNSSV